MRKFVSRAGEVPELIKGDVKSAYRRVPLKESDRWAAGVAFKAQGQVRAFKLC